MYSKPSFQHKLHGTQRLLPDISWLADPFTGGVIAITEPFTFPPLQWGVVGGTSLATPMFSGLWAIANQEAGVPLGQVLEADAVPAGAAAIFVALVVGMPLAILPAHFATYDTTPKLVVLCVSAAVLLWLPAQWWPGVADLCEANWAERSIHCWF